LEKNLKKAKNHKHEYIGGMCNNCTDEEVIKILSEDDVNDEEVTRYKTFVAG
jgi:hypothetical protein